MTNPYVPTAHVNKKRHWPLWLGLAAVHFVLTFGLFFLPRLPQPLTRPFQLGPTPQWLPTDDESHQQPVSPGIC